MTANEKSARKKIRISIIDFLIVITLLACILGVFFHYRVFKKDNEVVTTDTCYVSVMLYGVDNDLSEKIAIGDKIYLKEGNQTFGSVSDVIKEDSSVYYTNVANQISESVDSTKKDVAIIIEVNGDVKQDGFFANGVKYVAAGMEIDVFSSDFSGKGLIFGVEQRSE